MISSLHILIWEEVFLSQMIKGTRNKVKYWWENHKSLYTIPWSHQSMNEFWIPPHLLILDILTLSWKHFHFKKTFCLNLYNSNKVKGLYINLNFIEIQRYLMEWKPRILYKRSAFLYSRWQSRSSPCAMRWGGYKQFRMFLALMLIIGDNFTSTTRYSIFVF